MTREEAIQILVDLIDSPFLYTWEKQNKALHMAIEALQESKTIIGIDTPYGSDKGIATLFKGKNDKLILEDIKEIMSVVRCKDCKYQDKCEEVILFDINDDEIIGHHVHWCSHGERKKK